MPVETRNVSQDEDGMRLDRWFKIHYATLPHSRLEKLLRTGQVRVDGGRAKASTRLAAGQSIRVPPLPDMPPPASAKRALSKADRDFLASITLYEDNDLLILNKPSGLAVQGGTKPGYSSGYSLETVERLAQETLPEGYAFQWTELAYQEKQAGDTALLVFVASVDFVFLLLAAQYESWGLPLAVILICPCVCWRP